MGNSFLAWTALVSVMSLGVFLFASTGPLSLIPLSSSYTGAVYYGMELPYDQPIKEKLSEISGKVKAKTDQAIVQGQTGQPVQLPKQPLQS